MRRIEEAVDLMEETAFAAHGGALYRIGLLADMVRLEEVLFSLPLAYAGAILGARTWPPLVTWIWITAAVAGGKVGGMALNRLVDRDLDAQNPATAGRHLPAGLITPTGALLTGIFGLAVLTASALALNPLCALLLPLVIGLLIVYSFTKRWGWFCHFALASIGFFLPFSGWIAVTGHLAAGPVLFGAAAGLWYIGFDSLYALRDVESDRRAGLHSMPADLGVPTTLAVARIAHAGFLALLVVLGAGQDLPWPYWASVVAAGVILAWQHTTIARSLRPVGWARFNTYVSIALLAGTAVSAALGMVR